jgi:putative metallohydrolase (TIGR04338 family)
MSYISEYRPVFGKRVKPKKARDSQRSKVYKAELYKLDEYRAPILETVAKIDAWVNGKILRSSWLRKNFPLAPEQLEIHPGFSRRKASGSIHGLWLPMWARSKLVILHEVSHSIVSSEHSRQSASGHGWQFTSTFLKLVKHFIGNAAHDQLKENYKKLGVKYKAPKKLSPETLEKLRARGQALAAARWKDKDK